MDIVEPYARLLDVPDREAGIALLRKIEWCARISHASEDAQTEDSWERFLTTVVLKRNDFSVTEHAVASVDILCDRGISHELVRHRLFSYTQASTRFINYNKKMVPQFICPLTFKTDQQRSLWEDGIGYAEASYQALLAEGCAPQIARSVFPNSLATRIIMTGNIRNWRHVLNLRVTRETHPQFREVTIPLLQQFKSRIPLLFDDIVENDTQANAMKRPR